MEEKIKIGDLTLYKCISSLNWKVDEREFLDNIIKKKNFTWRRWHAVSKFLESTYIYFETVNIKYDQLYCFYERSISYSEVTDSLNIMEKQFTEDGCRDKIPPLIYKGRIVKVGDHWEIIECRKQQELQVNVDGLALSAIDFEKRMREKQNDALRKFFE